MVLGESCQVQNDVCDPSYTNENKHLCLCAGECAQDFEHKGKLNISNKTDT